jgi:hypothetical protein|tara:strand:+ start:5549 stop:5752 length:204 start_codon:yes stop_codon:yes gene_type:complete
MSTFDTIQIMLQNGEGQDFVDAYTIAKENNLETFTYCGTKYDTEFAGYMVMFMQGFLKQLKDDHIRN